MAISQAIRLVPEAARSLAFGSVAAGYTGVGTAISNPARILHIQNLTDVVLMFSYDGVDDHFPLASNAYLLLDITANKSRDQGFYLAEGTRIYVKQDGIPASGSVYVTVYYGATE